MYLTESLRGGEYVTNSWRSRHSATGQGHAVTYMTCTYYPGRLLWNDVNLQYEEGNCVRMLKSSLFLSVSPFLSFFFFLFFSFISFFFWQFWEGDPLQHTENLSVINPQTQKIQRNIRIDRLLYTCHLRKRFTSFRTHAVSDCQLVAPRAPSTDTYKTCRQFYRMVLRVISEFLLHAHPRIVS